MSKRRVNFQTLRLLAGLMMFGGLKEGARPHTVKSDNWKPNFSLEEKRQLDLLSGYSKKVYVREIRKKYDAERCEQIRLGLGIYGQT